MFLTLDEYLLGARKLIAKYGLSCHVEDEDAISYVAQYMMKADETCDETKSARNTWRINQARYAIMNLRTKFLKDKKHKTLSLNVQIKNNGGRSVQLSDTIPDNRMDNTKEEQYNQVINAAQNVLSGRRQHCFLSYYKKGKTLQEIGDELGITKEAVRQQLEKGIKILQRCKSISK